MASVPKDWEDAPSTATPLSAAALEDQEARLAAWSAKAAKAIAAYGGIPCATRVSHMGGSPPLGQLSDGVLTTQTARLKSTATRDVCGIRLGFGNWNASGDGPNTVTVKAAVETSGGVIMPVFFNGASSAILNPGGLLVSDPVGIEFADGDQFWTRTNVTVASGEKWPIGLTTENYSGGPGEGATNSDATLSGTISTSFTGVFSPVLILGASPANPAPVIALLGDSVISGLSDQSSGGGSQGDQGFAIRALNSNFAYVTLGRGGERASQFVAPATSQARKRLLDGATHAIVNYGINDAVNNRTAVQIEGDLTTIYTWLTKRGITVYGTTITPKATSTDSFATVGNQTPIAQNAARVTVNNWIRTTPAPLAGYFETADTVESSRDSGKWAVGMVTVADGTHPNRAGHAAMAAVIDTSFFVV